jgi:cephalosporin hydroxylase
MSDFEEFRRRNQEMIVSMRESDRLRQLTKEWFLEASRHEYSYHFTWLGVPVIQFPQDMIAMQELIWKIRPQVIVETGVARGGSLVYYASLLDLIGQGEVLGIDVDLRPHNRRVVEEHPMSRRIGLIEGSSTSEDVFAEVQRRIGERSPVLVVLDSNHTHDHVLAELHRYAPLVSVGSYCVVMDTVIQDMPPEFVRDRPWRVGDNPKTAVQAYLASDDRFEIDADLCTKLAITVAPGGYLKRVR